MEISGGLVFAETSTVPNFDCNVNVLFAGKTYSVLAKDGVWSTALDAPATSGSMPMTWEVGCLEGQGTDLTDQATSVKWILVDGTGPEPQEVLSRDHEPSLAVKITKFGCSFKNWAAWIWLRSSWSGRLRTLRPGTSFGRVENRFRWKVKPLTDSDSNSTAT